MKNLWVSLLVTFLLMEVVFAQSHQSADQFVEYWNMGEDRAEQNEVVFTQGFIERRGADGLARIMHMVYGDNGDITIDSITAQSDEQVTLLASAERGNWMEIVLDLPCSDW
jgi:hypothetical protein